MSTVNFFREKLRPDYEGIETWSWLPGDCRGQLLGGEKLRPDYEGIETPSPFLRPSLQTAS